MELSRLQLDLRPRPNAQALDLGFALLRSHVGDVYKVWLCLWLPLIGLALILSYFFPSWGPWLPVLPWWLRPLLERAPLYIFSRQVFGEEVTWQQALRAWPSQLGGGWFRLLTWWRLFVPSRGLYQAIWQLEGARGAVAAERRRVIGKLTASSAYWFGVACAHFEVVLQFGILAAIGLFFSDENSINPFAIFFDKSLQNNHLLQNTVGIIVTGFAGAIMGPIYTACTFTLYLNRRATLEAWDIEIMLRQLKAPSARTSLSGSIAALLLPLLFICGYAPTPADAATVPAANTEAKLPPSATKCTPPTWSEENKQSRLPAHDADQQRIRNDLDSILSNEDLRGYRCEETWIPKDKSEKKKKKEPKKKSQLDHLPNLEVLATIFKVIVITGAIALLVWLLYRYQGNWGFYLENHKLRRATQVAGLDIRPESLPDNIADEVLKLWQAGQFRAALALLYRASLSRLVSHDQLVFNRGATEGDCLRIAKEAAHRQQLRASHLQVFETTTLLWQQVAYAGRWPDEISTLVSQWQREFDSTEQSP